MSGSTLAQMQVNADSLENLFKKGLKGMASVLNKDLVCSVDHYDCVMKVKITAADSGMLFMKFLNKAVELTHIQKAVFCHVYVEEFTPEKLVGQLYGCWYEHLDLEIKSVADCALSVCPDDRSWKGSVAFELYGRTHNLSVKH